MLLLVTAVAVSLGWLLGELKFVRERRDFLVLLDDYRSKEMESIPPGRFVLAGVMTPAYEESTIPIWRRWLGDEAKTVILLPANTPEADYQKAKRLFPETKYFGKDGVAVPNE
jgi:hypothetical protein